MYRNRSRSNIGFINFGVEVLYIQNFKVYKQIVLTRALIDLCEVVFYGMCGPECSVFEITVTQDYIECHGDKTEQSSVRKWGTRANWAESDSVLFDQNVYVRDSRRLVLPCVWKPFLVQPRSCVFHDTLFYILTNGETINDCVGFYDAEMFCVFDECFLEFLMMACWACDGILSCVMINFEKDCVLVFGHDGS